MTVCGALVAGTPPPTVITVSTIVLPTALAIGLLLRDPVAYDEFAAKLPKPATL
jgi:hypothetical protein